MKIERARRTGGRYSRKGKSVARRQERHQEWDEREVVHGGERLVRRFSVLRLVSFRQFSEYPNEERRSAGAREKTAIMTLFSLPTRPRAFAAAFHSKLTRGTTRW